MEYCEICKQPLQIEGKSKTELKGHYLIHALDASVCVDCAKKNGLDVYNIHEAIIAERKRRAA